MKEKRGFTYRQIQEYVKEHYDYIVQTCIIAAVLRELGYDVGTSPNRLEHTNKPKIPTDRDRKAIREAIEYLTKH